MLFNINEAAIGAFLVIRRRRWQAWGGNDRYCCGLCNSNCVSVSACSFARLDALVRVELDVERAVGLVAEEGTESFERVTCVAVLCVALTRIVEVVRMVSVILVVI